MVKCRQHGGMQPRASEKVVERIQSILVTVCTSVQRRAQAPDEDEEEEGLSAKALKMKSIVQMKEEAAERLRLRKYAQQEAEKLGDLIRLADYMVVEALADRLAVNFRELLFELRATRKEGVFKILVLLDEATPILEPPHSHVEESVTAQIEGAVDVFATVPRVSETPFFRQLLTQTSQLVITQLVRDDPDVARTRAAISSALQDDFNAATEYSVAFEQYLAIWNLERDFDFEAFSESEQSVESIGVLNRTKEQTTMVGCDWAFRSDPQVDSRRLKTLLHHPRAGRERRQGAPEE